MKPSPEANMVGLLPRNRQIVTLSVVKPRSGSGAWHENCWSGDDRKGVLRNELLYALPMRRQSSEGLLSCNFLP